METLFPLGQCVITANAKNTLHPEDAQRGLERHAQGDFGELDPDDLAENQRALREGLRLLSRYTDRNGRVFWCITEHDRSVTTILLPEDY